MTSVLRLPPVARPECAGTYGDRRPKKHHRLCVLLAVIVRMPGRGGDQRPGELEVPRPRAGV